MFERFTERARLAVVLADEEARALKHDHLGSEHILLGLLREPEGLAAQALAAFDVSIEEVRAQVVRIVGRGDKGTAGHIPLTPRAKKALELALREALLLGHNYIGTEHILLGLVHDTDGVAARILLDLDVDAEKIRTEVLRLLQPTPSASRSPESVKARPYSSPLTREVRQAIDSLRRAKERAIEAGDFERGTEMRSREKLLAQPARALEQAWSEFCELDEAETGGVLRVLILDGDWTESSLEARLEAVVAEGWELVSVVERHSGPTAFFKRSSPAD